jgi:replicative DNA helicase
MVMFVYRDEYYNPDTTEKPGVAELIIGKHRNGPVGSVELTFLERYPKFASIARERIGGEGSGAMGGAA